MTPDELILPTRLLREAGITRNLEKFFSTLYGRLLIVLLCNVQAKQHQRYYTYKVPLIRWALELLDADSEDDNACWWVDQHDYGAYGKVVVIIRSRGYDFAFHLRGTDLESGGDLLARAPTPNGRRWNGIPLQPIAVALVREYAGLPPLPTPQQQTFM